MPEADQDRAGQGGQVDDRRRLVVALHVGERVGEHEPAFGVGVDHLDRLAGHGGDHVARPLGVARRHVLDQPADADDIGLGLAQGERLEGSDHGPGAAHVPLHRFHALGRLDRNAAGVEGDAFADERERRVALLAAVPAQDQQPRIAHRALGDAEQRPHAELLHRRPVEHFELDAQIGEVADPFDERLGINDIGWLGDQLAGQLDPFEHRLPPLLPALPGSGAGADDRHLLERRLLLVLELGVVAVVAPRAQRGTEADASRGIRVIAKAGEVDYGVGLAGGQQSRRGRAAQLLGRRRGGNALARADNQQPLRSGSQEQLDGAAGIALEALALQRRFDPVCQSLDRVRVGAVGRKYQRIIPVGKAVGEIDLHEGGSLKGSGVGGSLGREWRKGKVDEPRPWASPTRIVARGPRCDRLAPRQSQVNGGATGLRKGLVWWSALPMLLGAPANALAQPVATQPAEPGASPADSVPVVNFSADQVSYDSDNELVTATGAVRMSRDGNYLAADQVTWNRKTGEVRAAGNVVVVNPQGDKLVGNSVVLTDTLRDGTIENLLVVLESGGRIAAARGTRTGDITTLDNAIYSACPVTKPSGCPRNPSWSITAARVVYDPNRNRVRFQGGRLQLFGVTLPLLPVFSIGTASGSGGVSGWLVPEISFSSRNGLEVGMPYYQQVFDQSRPHADAAFVHRNMAGVRSQVPPSQ